MRIKLLAAFIAGCLIVPPGVAFAGPEEAAQYYEQASKAYEDGEYAEAADLLERAYAEDPNLIYQYNRILALQAMGKIDQALKVLDIYGNPMREDGRFDDIKDIRVQLEQAQAKAAADKAKTAETSGDATSGDDPSGDGTSGDDTSGDDTYGDQNGVAAPVDSSPNILGWSLVGVGVVGLGVGSLFGSKVFIADVADRDDRLKSGESFSEVYGDFDDPNAQLKADQDAWSTNRVLNWTFIGVGSAALIGGGTLLVMDAMESPAGTESEAPLSADKADIRLTPYVGADGAGGVLRILF